MRRGEGDGNFWEENQDLIKLGVVIGEEYQVVGNFIHPWFIFINSVLVAGLLDGPCAPRHLRDQPQHLLLQLTSAVRRTHREGVRYNSVRPHTLQENTGTFLRACAYRLF